VQNEAALAAYFVFASGASIITKVVVLGVLGGGLLCIYWLHRYSTQALFVMAGLGLFILLYRQCAQALSSDRRD
jgi:hypothetical protein